MEPHNRNCQFHVLFVDFTLGLPPGQDKARSGQRRGEHGESRKSRSVG